MSSFFWPPKNGSGGGVSSLNGLTGGLTLVAGSGITITPSGSNITIAATGAGSGTVTSVALSVPSFLSVSGSPITTSGTLAVTLNTETANFVFAGPPSGGPAIPTFRLLVAADIPALSYVTSVTASAPLSSSGGTTPNISITSGNLTDAGTDGITVTNGTGAVIGTGTSLSQHVADSTHNGYLSSTDWNTFNNKQPAGSYITALTGDVTASGPGSAVATLANVGTAGTYVKVTTNAKGLVTSGSVAPLGPTDGGTGLTSYTTGDTLYASASNTLSKLPIGTSGEVLTVVAGIPSWAAAMGAVTTFAFSNNQTSFADVTGFLVAPASSHAFTSDISVERTTGTYISDQEDVAFYTNLGTAFNGLVQSTIQQADTSILMGGSFTTFNGNTRNRLVKTSSTGVEDTTFATNLGTGFDNAVFTVAEQSDTKILVGGTFNNLNGNGFSFIVRLNADGTEDTAFRTNLGTGFNNNVNSIFVQADQKILIVGDFSTFNGNTRGRIVRLNSDGTEDTTFATNTGTGTTTGINVVYQEADTTVLVGGAFTTFNGNTRNHLVRLNSDGTEDTTFYTNLGTAFNGNVLTLVEQANTEILVGGTFTTFNGNTRGRIVRLNSDGTEDTTFATNTGTGFASTVQTIALQGTNIIVGGNFTSFNGNTREHLVRLDSTGTEDTAFYTSLGTAFVGNVRSVYTQTNGQLLIGGSFTTFNGNTRNDYIRYELILSNDLVSIQTIRGVYHSSSTSWVINGFDTLGDDTGIIFQMTDLGQLQYKSSNLSGTATLNQMKFEILEL